MKVKSLAPWFGGKRTLAPAIVKQLGKHTQYFEPFCGSMAVLFAKEPSQKETVNDLHGDLINLARVVSDLEAAQQLYRRLEGTLFTEGILREARSILSDPLPELPPRGVDDVMLERAYWYFVGCWMGRNGTAGLARIDYQLAVRWTKGGGSPTVRWRNAYDSLPEWHVRLQRVVILQRDAFDIIDRFEDCPETAIYVDPPYAGESRSKGDYLHEFNHEAAPLLGELDDHERLADILKGYKRARVVVSYYDCPRVRQIYDGWTFIEHTRQKNLHSQNGRGSRGIEAPELLIVNGEASA